MPQPPIERAKPNWPKVVVAGGYITGIVLMRNLRRRGLQIHCIDTSREQPAFRSVYGESHLCPNPDRDPEQWLQFMKELASRIGGKPVLIPSADIFVSAVAAHADQLRNWYVFAESASAVHGLLATKERQYDLAGAHGLPVPRTEFLTSMEQALAFGRAARFPCILKPLHARYWDATPNGHPLHGKKLLLAATLEELAAQYEMAAAVTPNLVAQEVIEGPDTAKLVYLSCYGRSGQRIGACMVRQLRTAPILFGSASVVEPVLDPETDALCDQFLRSLGYVGLCEIELKRDTRDGQVRMIEANPRYSVTADAAPYAGVDLGWLQYLDLIGERVEPVTQSARNFRHIVLMRDFVSMGEYRRAGLLSWGELLRSYRPPVAFFDFDLRDWRVTADTCVTLCKMALAPWVRRIFPKRTKVRG